MSIEIGVSLLMGLIQAIQAATNKQEAVSTPHIVSGSVNAVVDAVLEMLLTLENQTRRELAQRAPTPYPIKNEQTPDDDHPATPNDADHPVVKQEQDLGSEQPAPVPRANLQNAPSFQQPAPVGGRHNGPEFQHPAPFDNPHQGTVFRRPVSVEGFRTATGLPLPQPAEALHIGPRFPNLPLLDHPHMPAFYQYLPHEYPHGTIFVHVPSGRNFATTITIDTSIGDIRHLISDREGIAPHEQHLDCDGRCLVHGGDGATLESLGIRGGSVLTLYDH